MTSREQNILKNYVELLAGKAGFSIGYPFSVDFDYSELYGLLQYPIANVGDPFIESNYGVNSFSIEREVIHFFARLFRAPENNYSGYVTSGGTEGNLYGLYIARELYPEGIVYHSSESHYSISKNIRLLNMKAIEISADEKGEIDYQDLEMKLRLNSHLPAIVVANIGTTMTEAKDDVPRIKNIITDLGIESHYIHCDAALAGAYLPLLEGNPKFDFANGADSIACSGHKFIGSPMPCGIVIVKKDYKEQLGEYISYIGSLDTTITGSRNGLSPIFLWYTISKIGKEGLRQRISDALLTAEYTQKKLQENNISSFRNENAITVVFPKPNDRICAKWQLAVKNGMAHIMCMPGITLNKIDNFIEDLLIAETDAVLMN